jgi:tetratricopeptide (TPR) repeat protein
MGKLQKTVESLEKAILLDNENPDAYLKLAEMSIVIRDYKKALGYINIALGIDELIDKAYMLRGVIHLEKGDTLMGIRDVQKAIDINQQYLEAHIQLGTIYAAMKNDLAVDYFNNALNIDPDHIDVQYFLGMYYQETGKYEKAIQSYNSILGREPSSYIANFNIGYINLVYLQDFDRAIDYFTRTIEINPAYTEAYYNRGFAYELKKDTENSRNDYNKVLELHPNYEKAIDGLNRISEYQEMNRSL